MSMKYTYKNGLYTDGTDMYEKFFKTSLDCDDLAKDADSAIKVLTDTLNDVRSENPDCPIQLDWDGGEYCNSFEICIYKKVTPQRLAQLEKTISDMELAQKEQRRRQYENLKKEFDNDR